MTTNPKTGSEEFGELLRRGRGRLGMSRRDLVDATGLSYPYVSQLETGYRQPSPAAIRKLADALRLSLDELFTAMGRGGGDRLAPPDLPEVDPVAPTGPPAQGIRSGWVHNAGFAGASAGGKRTAASGARAGEREPAAGLSAPIRLSASTPAPLGDPWSAALRVEPVAADPDARSSGPDDDDAVVDQAVGLLNSLPPATRLAALTRLQAEIVQSLIDDGVRDAATDP